MQSRQQVTDSLRTALAQETDREERLRILINLNDLVLSVKDSMLVHQLISEATEMRDVDALEIGYCKLLFDYANQCDYHSIMDLYRRSLDILPYDIATGEAMYALWYADAYFLRQNDDEECDKLFESAAKQYSSNGVASRAYDKMRILNLYIEGAARQRVKHGGDFISYDEQVCDYLWQMFELANALPHNYIGDKVRSHILISLLANNTINIEDVRRCERQLIEVLDRFDDYEIRQNRPYLSNAVRLNFYSAMMAMDCLAQSERDEYYAKCMEALQEDISNMALTPNLAMLYRERYQCNYLEAKDELTPSDSIAFMEALRYLSQKDSPLSALWTQKRLVTLLRDRGEYKEASDVQVRVSELIDTMYTNESEDLFHQLQIEMGRVENMQLTQRMRGIIICGACVVLVIAALLLVYMYRQGKVMRIANKKILEVDEIKARFFQSLCHEIRTPLNAISGFSQLIVSDRPLSDARKRYFSDAIISETDRLTGMLDELLFVASMLGGDGNSDREPVRVGEVVARLIDEFARKHQDKYWTYECDYEEPILSNSEQLERVLRGLMDNVSKHCPSGTRCRIVCRLTKKHIFEIAVIDDGPGIHIDKHEYVFHSFTKLDRFSQGVGIGLFMCREMIRHLGGSIRIDAEYKDGTRVVVSLPING